MATYLDLLTKVAADDTFRQRVRVACVVAATAVCLEVSSTPYHPERMLWARSVFIDPETQGNRMLNAVLGQNAAYAVAVILGAQDADILAAVMNAVNVFAVTAV